MEKQKTAGKPTVFTVIMLLILFINGSVGVRYSIGYTTENRPVVIIEENILENVPKSQWVKVVKNTISEKFSGGIPVSGRLIKVNKITNREFTFSENSKYYKSKDKTKYYDKPKSANNLDEIVLASTDYVAEIAKHKNFKEFARGKVNFRVDNNGYQADIIVGITANKTAVLYDIVSIKNKKITELLNTTSETKSFQNRSNNSVTNSIPDNSGNVNTSDKKFSLSSPIEQVATLSLCIILQRKRSEGIWSLAAFLFREGLLR